MDPEDKETWEDLWQVEGSIVCSAPESTQMCKEEIEYYAFVMQEACWIIWFFSHLVQPHLKLQSRYDVTLFDLSLLQGDLEVTK
jgi:hypothetical protein